MNKKLRFISLMAVALTTMGTLAQGPNNSKTYYQAANNQKGQALKTALHNIIANPKVTSYSGLYDAYKKTDKRADGKVRDWYSNITNYDWNEHGNSKEGAGWNREHLVPQSWFEASTGTPKSDVVQVVPTDSWVNSMRSNYPLAEVGSVSKQSAGGYCKLGTCKTAGYSGTVFEPNDEIKGDIARIYFYMVTCYEESTQWGHAVFSTVKYPGLQQWYLDMLMRWSKQDPVDERETARNNAAYEVQKNRNPFVDYPGLENYVWGSKKETAFSYDHYDSGTGPDVTTVDQPVFSPNGGTFTDKVEVAMTTTTSGATIYYTTNGAEVTEQSKVYQSPVTLTSTTTLKAMAVKDGVRSYQTVATYTITKGGDEQPIDGMISLNNQLFGTSYGGSISKSDDADLVGTQNGITVVYSLGEGGANRYCNDSQIRLYQNNKLTISVAEGWLSELEFQLAKETSKTLQASTGSVNGLTWTGNAQQVTLSVDEGSGNMQLTGVKVKISGITGIDHIKSKKESKTVYSLSGKRQAKQPAKAGVYISKGKKYLGR